MLTRSPVRIEVPARLHLGLIAMGNGGPRMNGGLGFAITGPSLRVVAVAGDETTVVDNRIEGLDSTECDALRSHLEMVCREEGLTVRPRICIEGDVASHFGLGAGTGIRLAAIEATLLLGGLDLCPADLIARSGRGGTSGVGIRTYFEGGLTFDLGRRGHGGHRPSHDWAAPPPPLPLARIALPEQWRFGLCVPPGTRSLSHAEERAVFAAATPVAAEEAHRTLFIALMGVFASAAEGDIQAFADAVDELQGSAWKRAERQAHGPALIETGTALRSAGARGIGLSSMGPLLYFSADEFRLELLPHPLRRRVRIVRPQNSGRQVIANELATA